MQVKMAGMQELFDGYCTKKKHILRREREREIFTISLISNTHEYSTQFCYSFFFSYFVQLRMETLSLRRDRVETLRIEAFCPVATFDETLQPSISRIREKR